MEPLHNLDDLLISLFDGPALVRFLYEDAGTAVILPHLPSEHEAVVRLVHRATIELTRRGLIDVALFDRLTRAFPARAGDIRGIADTYVPRAFSHARCGTSRRTLAAAACFAAIASAVAWIMIWHLQAPSLVKPHVHDAPDAPEPPRAPAPSRPADDAMVTIVGGRATFGSTFAERTAALTLCRGSAASGCDPAFYEREIVHTRTIAEFAIDRHEVTNRGFRDWLAALPELQFRPVGALPGALAAAADGVELAYVRDLSATRGSVGERLELLGLGLASGGQLVALRPDEPALFVSWDAADRHCRSLGKRLPDEYEWEYAARGAERRMFPWGGTAPLRADCSRVVFGRTPGELCADFGFGPASIPGPTREQTAEGVVDLGGNASEWTASQYDEPTPCRAGASCCPPGRCYVVRGGSWAHDAEYTRAAGRIRRNADDVADTIGFRCAR